MLLNIQASTRYAASMALIAATVCLSACATPRSYMGLDIGPGAEDSSLTSLARRAQTGDQQAQLELGIAYEEGRGVRRNLLRAMQLYEEASRASGGSRIIHRPRANGSVDSQPVYSGPRTLGLEEARVRLAAIQRQRARYGINRGTSLNRYVFGSLLGVDSDRFYQNVSSVSNCIVANEEPELRAVADIIVAANGNLISTRQINMTIFSSISLQNISILRNNSGYNFGSNETFWYSFQSDWERAGCFYEFSERHRRFYFKVVDGNLVILNAF
jgi:hypothetical protein